MQFIETVSNFHQRMTTTNICSYSDPFKMVIRNLDVVSLDADSITAKTLTVDSVSINGKIVDIDNRLVVLEDKTANQSRSGTSTRFTGIVDVDTISPLTQPSVTISPSLSTTGSISCLGQLSTAGDLSAANTLFVKASTHRVGINQTSPSYDLDVTGSARVTGTFYLEGNFAGSTLSTPSNPVTLSGATQVFTFPNAYVKKITIAFINSEYYYTAAAANNNFVIQLGTSTPAYIGTGYNGGYGSISAAPSIANWACGIAIAQTATSTWSGIQNGQIVLMNAGNNIWVWDGAVRTGTTTVGFLYAGSVDCGANVIDRIRLSSTSTTATYSQNVGANMRGQMNVIYEY